MLGVGTTMSHWYLEVLLYSTRIPFVPLWASAWNSCIFASYIMEPCDYFCPCKCREGVSDTTQKIIMQCIIAVQFFYMENNLFDPLHRAFCIGSHQPWQFILEKQLINTFQLYSQNTISRIISKFVPPSQNDQ